MYHVTLALPVGGLLRGSPVVAGEVSFLEVRTMRRLLGCTAIAVVSLTLGVGSWADEGDEKVPLDKIPAKVKEAIKAKYPKAEIVSAAKGDVDGTKVYEFALKEGDRKWEAAFTLEGKFHSSEEVLTEAQLPAKVKEAFRKKYPDAKVLAYEKAIEGEGTSEKVIYEILIEKGKDKVEVQIAPDGKIVGEEVKKE